MVSFETYLIFLTVGLSYLVVKLGCVLPKTESYTLFLPETGKHGVRVCMIGSWPGCFVGFLNHLEPPTDYVLGFKVGWYNRTFHTVGMHFSIDLVALDRNGNVLEVKEHLPPGRRGIKLPRQTRAVLEFASGHAYETIKRGCMTQLVKDRDALLQTRTLHAERSM